MAVPHCEGEGKSWYQNEYRPPWRGLEDTAPFRITVAAYALVIELGVGLGRIKRLRKAKRDVGRGPVADQHSLGIYGFRDRFYHLFPFVGRTGIEFEVQIRAECLNEALKDPVSSKLD